MDFLVTITMIVSAPSEEALDGLIRDVTHAAVRVDPLYNLEYEEN